jgi:hypothetical protein
MDLLYTFPQPTHDEGSEPETMKELRSTLTQLADRFVTSLLAAMASASIGDLAEGSRATVGRVPAGRREPRTGAVFPATRTPGTRRRRASSEEVQNQKDVALVAAKELKPGFSKGDVMRKSASKVDLGRAISLLVAEGKLSKKGDRRKARYWVK